MKLATEERTHSEPVRASGGGTRLGGTDIFRGVLVIVTAIIIGGFVISRGLDTPEGADDELTSPDTSVVDAATLAEDGAAEDDAAGQLDGGTETTLIAPADDQQGAGSAEAAGPAVSTPTTGTSTDVMPEETTTTEPALRPPAQVKVLVLNAAQTQGIAARGTEALLAQNYLTGAPKNANSGRPSAILYTETYQPEALVVASVFGTGLESLVQPLDPQDLPIDDTQQANIIIVIGPDDLIPIP